MVKSKGWRSAESTEIVGARHRDVLDIKSPASRNGISYDMKSDTVYATKQYMLHVFVEGWDGDYPLLLFRTSEPARDDSDGEPVPLDRKGSALRAEFIFN